jgi:hypothetical protein
MICIRCYSFFQTGYTLSALTRRSHVSNFLNEGGGDLFPALKFSEAYRLYAGFGQFVLENNFSSKIPQFHPSKDLYKDSQVERSGFSPWQRFYANRWSGFSGVLIPHYRDLVDLVLDESTYFASWCYRGDFYSTLLDYNINAHKKSTLRGSSRLLAEKWRDVSLNISDYVVRGWEEERQYKHNTRRSMLIDSFIENVLVMKRVGLYNTANPPSMTWEQVYGTLEKSEEPVPLMLSDYTSIEDMPYNCYHKSLLSTQYIYKTQKDSRVVNFLSRAIRLVNDVERRISATTFNSIEFYRLDLHPGHKDLLFTAHFRYLQALFLWREVFFKKLPLRPTLFRKSTKTMSLLYRDRLSRAIRIPFLKVKTNPHLEVLAESWTREAIQNFLFYRKRLSTPYLKRMLINLINRDLFLMASFTQLFSLRGVYLSNTSKYIRSWSMHSIVWDSRSYTRWVASLNNSLIQSNLTTTLSLLTTSFQKNSLREDSFISSNSLRLYWSFWLPIIIIFAERLGLPYPNVDLEGLRLVSRPGTLVISYFDGSFKSDYNSGGVFTSLQSGFFLPKELRISKARLSRDRLFQYPVTIKELEGKVHAQGDFSRMWQWVSQAKERYEASDKTTPLHPVYLSILFSKLLFSDRKGSFLSNYSRRLLVASYNQIVLRIKLLGDEHRYVFRKLLTDTLSFSTTERQLNLYQDYLERGELLKYSVKQVSKSRIQKDIHLATLTKINIHRPWIFSTSICVSTLPTALTFADDPNGWLFIKPLKSKDRLKKQIYSSSYKPFSFRDFNKASYSNVGDTVNFYQVFATNRCNRLKQLKQDINYFKKYFSVYDAIKKLENL